MKILMGSFQALSILGGGVLVQVRSLADELQRLGVEVELLDPWKAYRLEEFDFVHLFGAHVGTYHLGRALTTLGAKLVLSPVFYSRHSPRKVAARTSIARQLRRRGGLWTEHMFCKELCDMASLVMPNTHEEATMVQQAFGVPPGRIRVLPNGVSPRFAAAKPDAFVSKYRLDRFLLYVGHIGWGRKNTLPMLKVVERIGCRTVLIGELLDTAYGRNCRAVMDRCFNVTHIPALPADAEMLASAYAACDTLILPSLYETPGLAALEAGLAGAKVCITEHGGTREYFRDLATYLEPKSESSIQEAISRSLARPRDDALRSHIAANYLWERAARTLTLAYQELLALSAQ